MKLHSPAAERNAGPILEQLQRLLGPKGRALEIAAGSGQHARHFCTALTDWHWQPSDPQPEALASIRAHRAELDTAQQSRLAEPLQLDVRLQPWPAQGPFDLVYSANMLHIAPWDCCAALMQGSAAVLSPEGQLIIYGPFVVPGLATAPSNLAFDADLRGRNPQWGLRELEAVEACARAAGLRLRERIAMPANNQLLVFSR